MHRHRRRSAVVVVTPRRNVSRLSGRRVGRCRDRRRVGNDGRTRATDRRNPGAEGGRLIVNLDELVAIDVHTHAEMSADGHPSLSPVLEAAKAAYFGARDSQPTIPQMAEYYRQRRIAVFDYTAAAE